MYLALMTSCGPCLPTADCKDSAGGWSQPLGALLRLTKVSTASMISSHSEVSAYYVPVAHFLKRHLKVGQGTEAIDPLHAEGDLLWLDGIAKCVTPQSLPLWEEKAVAKRHNEKLSSSVFSQRAGVTNQLSQYHVSSSS